MLSDQNVRRINNQIADELRTVDSICSSDQEKIAAIDRIAKLKSLLTPQPSRSDILAELAEALVEAQRNPKPTFADHLVSDILSALRR